MNNSKSQHGSLFSVEVGKGEYIYGRVLFDVNEQYFAQNSGEANAYFKFFKGCLLIETFEGVAANLSDVSVAKKAVVSSFVTNEIFDEDNWEVIGTEPVSPEEVSFPEVLMSTHPDVFFCAGEIRIKTPFDDDYREETGVYPSFGYGFTETDATLMLSGRNDLIEDEVLDNYFKRTDLRALPEARKEIYQILAQDMNQSYYEMALKHGFDLARFYGTEEK